MGTMATDLVLCFVVELILGLVLLPLRPASLRSSSAKPSLPPTHTHIHTLKKYIDTISTLSPSLIPRLSPPLTFRETQGRLLIGDLNRYLNMKRSNAMMIQRTTIIRSCSIEDSGPTPSSYPGSGQERILKMVSHFICCSSVPFSPGSVLLTARRPGTRVQQGTSTTW